MEQAYLTFKAQPVPVLMVINGRWIKDAIAIPVSVRLLRLNWQMEIVSPVELLIPLLRQE